MKHLCIMYIYSTSSSVDTTVVPYYIPVYTTTIGMYRTSYVAMLHLSFYFFRCCCCLLLYYTIIIITSHPLNASIAPTIVIQSFHAATALGQPSLIARLVR